MVKIRKTLGDRMLLFAMRRCVVGDFNGIALVDLRNGKHAESFKPTIEHSLRLIRDHDRRRFAIITRYFRSIVNQMNGTGSIAEYNERILACSIEFVPMADVDQSYVTAAYACLLIHEATHGLIALRGIGYDGQNRARIERLCTAEHNRFAARLASSDPAKYQAQALEENFDPANLERMWSAGRFRQCLSFLSRCLSDSKAELAAPQRE